jgi:DNA-binding response OmpR family regulator
MNRKTKVLIVDDDAPFAMAMISGFTHFDCDVSAAHNGKKAMELATQGRFDLIILNIKLPDMTGLEICSELKQRHISRNTPIIFISANPCETEQRQSLKLGAAGYMEKPFGARSIVSQVLSHVEKIPTTDSPFEEEFP